MSSWHKFTGRYIKTVYDCRLPDGSIVQVWPNAGKLHALDNSARQFKESDNVEIKPTRRWPE